MGTPRFTPEFKEEAVRQITERGYSVAEVSDRLATSAQANALSRPWPKGEWLIARALNIHPAEIWPSRYKEGGELLQPKKTLPVRCRL